MTLLRERAWLADYRFLPNTRDFVCAACQLKYS
jgi:hypothetical protein